MIMMFGDQRAKKNGNHFTYEQLKNRTSEFPNSTNGDMIGIIEFDRDNPNFKTNATDLGIDEHPSYKHILLGKGIFKFDKPFNQEVYANEWLMEKRRTFDKKTGKLKAINLPFWKREQTDFGTGRKFDQEGEFSLNSIISEENLIYSAEVISWITGEMVSSGPLKIDYDKKKSDYDKALKGKKADLNWDKNKPEFEAKKEVYKKALEKKELSLKA